MPKFRKVKFEMCKTFRYGTYEIIASYKGKPLSVFSTDSEAFDYLYSPEDKAKHLEAKQHCYYKIVSEYNKKYGR